MLTSRDRISMPLLYKVNDFFMIKFKHREIRAIGRALRVNKMPIAR